MWKKLYVFDYIKDVNYSMIRDYTKIRYDCKIYRWMHLLKLINSNKEKMWLYSCCTAVFLIERSSFK